MGKRINFTTEAELARKVVTWLTDQHWDVYQEVQTSEGMPIADIVATAGPRLCVVECKLSLGLRVIEQASYWSSWAHLVYIAVPPIGRRSGFAATVAGLFGLGVLEVSGYYGESVNETLRPAFNRRAEVRRFRKVLNDHHKTFAEAGNPHGRRWTPFQNTCEQVRRYVQIHPGATLKEVIDNVKTHYGTPATARTCIAKYADQGIIPGIRIERIGRAVRVWPDEK